MENTIKKDLDITCLRVQVESIYNLRHVILRPGLPAETAHFDETGGRVDVGFLGAAQIDRFANLNSTVIGSYVKPKTRLPGAGGASEIAAHAKQRAGGA